MRTLQVFSTQRTCRQRACAGASRQGSTQGRAPRSGNDVAGHQRGRRTAGFWLRPATLLLAALIAALALLSGQPALAAQGAAVTAAQGPDTQGPNQGWWQPAGMPGVTVSAVDATPAAVPAATPAAPDAAAPAAAPSGGTGGVRSDIIHYTVQSGDTLYGLAGTFNVSVETLIWANGLEANPSSLSLGQDLVVLPVSGVLHTVQAGDTLSGISARYDVSQDDIRALSANHLEGDSPLLHIGQQIIVPGGSKPQAAPPSHSVAAAAAPISAPAPANAPAGSSHFIWPISGTITQGYRPYHRAIDIGDPGGIPVKASDSGYVAVAGWSNVGYGNYVIIDHGNGYRTLYAHLSRIDVKPGAAVTQGQVIGAVGATGNATGPHLHFEILKGGVPLNPFNFLP